MVWEALVLGAAGAAGQLLRASYGLADALKKGEAIDRTRFAGTLIGGAMMGFVGGWLFGGDLRGAFLTGFAGVDFVEGLIRLRKP